MHLIKRIAPIALAVAFAVSSTPTAAQAASQDLTETQWTVTSVRMADGVTPVDPADIHQEPALTLNFDRVAPGRIDGYLGCNWVSGNYSAAAPKIEFGILGVTKRLCASGPWEQLESAYLQALQDTTGYRVLGNWLILSSSEGIEVILKQAT